MKRKLISHKNIDNIQSAKVIECSAFYYLDVIKHRT